MYFKHLYLLVGLALLAGTPVFSQSISGGTVAGSVKDPSGAVIVHAKVMLRNSVTGYEQTATTGADGAFRFNNVPLNPYRLNASASGFAASAQQVDVHSSLPMTVDISLDVAGASTAVTVEASGSQVETDPSAHEDVDRSSFLKLPTFDPGGQLSQAVTYSTGGVAADANGFFHPLGDHAQTSFSIDGQPISDQQSKGFSTQIPLNALQSMELITGAPGPEFGDKTSLVVNATTRSGLGQAQPTGSFVARYGSFGTVAEETAFAIGTPKFGNFVSANILRSGRFLDSPEFHPMHDVGNDETIFDRLDYQPNGKDAFHLNLFTARNWFQIPNTYDQINQDQRQQVRTFNIAPGYQRTFNSRTLLTLSAFIRQDQVGYYPSGDPFHDLPATISQNRRLTNYGLRGDIAYVRGHHNLKVGTQVTQTRLRESFSLALTDPSFNAVCLDSAQNPVGLPSVTNPGACSGLGNQPNPNLLPGLVPYDLTRGGTPLQFNDRGNINQYAFYVQDSITLGGLAFSPGLRVDRYDGLSQAMSVEPRIGVSYLVAPSHTVLRAAYSRTLETPYNENLLLSSATGIGGLGAGAFGSYGVEPLAPGHRNQYNAGLQQGFGRFLQVDADYFWKFTDNAYDFDTLFSTPITFPISWRKSKIDGVSVRLSTPDFHGFQAYNTMGHTRARFFGPETGGLIFNSPVNSAVFRIDHDQAFEQTTNLRYQRPKNGPWIAFTWRYDSGMVAGSVASLGDALSLTAAQQAAIGFYCGNQQAALGAPITSCTSPAYGATRLVIPAPGTENDDHNPPRIAPRHLFDIGVGTDNLFHTEHTRTTLKFTVVNMADNVALYNFLSTFSGTHFVTPRSYQAEVGIAF
jgi:Carboxypeptidase regulatory-like domain